MGGFAGVSKILALVVLNTTMLIGVVLVGKTMPKHVLFWVLMVCGISMCVYFPVALVTGGWRANSYNRALPHPRRSGVIGFWWGVNFWFVVWANSHVPGTMQVILNEMAVPVAMVTSYFVLGKDFDYVHIGAGIFITLGGLVPMATSQFDVGGWSALVWNVLYFINCCAIPIAVVFTEYFVKLEAPSARDRARIRHSEMPGFVSPTSHAVHQAAPYHGAKEYVVDLPWFLGWQSFYTALVCILLAIVLTPTTMTYTELWNDDLVGGAQCFFRGTSSDPLDDCTLGPILVVVAAVGSCGSNWLQDAVTRDESAVYSNMVTALAGPLATIYFSVPALMGRFYDAALAANAATIISLVTVFAAVAFYKYHGWRLMVDGREPLRTKATAMWKLNRDLPLEQRPYNELDDLPPGVARQAAPAAAGMLVDDYDDQVGVHSAPGYHAVRDL